MILVRSLTSTFVRFIVQSARFECLSAADGDVVDDELRCNGARRARRVFHSSAVSSAERDIDI